jgi:6-phospho-3-hexuloisomerase
VEDAKPEQDLLRSVIPGQIAALTGRIHEKPVEELIAAIIEADTIFTAGAGRSLLMMKAFAMRLVHLGIDAFVVGETSTPAIDADDLLIAASGSGVTRTTFAIVEAGRERGARTATITANPSGPIPLASDIVVEIPWPLTKISDSDQSPQPPGSLFEQTALVLGDHMVMRLMEETGTTPEMMRARHTKLE